MVSINSRNYLITTWVSSAAADVGTLDNRPAALIVEHINSSGKKNWQRF